MARVASAARWRGPLNVRIAVLHGPNLNLLGSRAPDHYGRRTLAEIDAMIRERGGARGIEVESFQSNDEGDIVDWIQDRSGTVDGWIVNAAGLTHTSVPLRDALEASDRPFVEVHLSNVYAREPFRHRSLLADLALGVIAGFRASSYLFGLDALADHLEERERR